MGHAAPVVKFTQPSESRSKNSEGVVTLAWEPIVDAPETEFELQQSEVADFSSTKIRYQGPDRGSVLSGFAEGEYHFRVRAIDPTAEWSEPVTVQIEYLSKRYVVMLLGVGVVVFLTTVGTLLTGHFRKPIH